MSKVTLQLHRGHLYLSHFESRDKVAEYCSADGCRWCGRDSDNVRGPAVNELVELGRRVLQRRRRPFDFQGSIESTRVLRSP
jgi:hypothetical protein